VLICHVAVLIKTCCCCCCQHHLQAKGLDLKEVDVPVIGGHAGATILPLLSQVSGSGCG
jgi:hypothetical protein